MMENGTEIKDISDADLVKILINEGFYRYDEITKELSLTLNVFIDEIEVWKRSRYKNVCTVMACVNEFDPDFRFEEGYLFALGGFQTRYKHNNSIMAAFSTLFQHASLSKEIHVNTFYGDGRMEQETLRVKCIVLAIIQGNSSIVCLIQPCCELFISSEQISSFEN